MVTQPFLIDSVTLAGNDKKPNEDRFGRADDLLWIIDGATGQGDGNCVADPSSSDAAWLADQLQNIFIQNATASDRMRTEFLHRSRTKILDLFHKVARHIPDADYAWPSAALSMVHVGEDTTTCTSLADCTVLFRHKNGAVSLHSGDPVHQKFDKQAVDHFIKLRDSKILPADADLYHFRSALLPVIRPIRSLANRDGGYGSFTLAEPLREEFIRISHRPTKDITHILLMTDGLYDIVDTYKLMSDQELMDRALANGLNDLALQVRAIENADPHAKSYPRFKKSDDATAALFDLPKTGLR